MQVEDTFKECDVDSNGARAPLLARARRTAPHLCAFSTQRPRPVRRNCITRVTAISDRAAGRVAAAELYVAVLLLYHRVNSWPLSGGLKKPPTRCARPGALWTDFFSFAPGI